MFSFTFSLFLKNHAYAVGGLETIGRTEGNSEPLFVLSLGVGLESGIMEEHGPEKSTRETKTHNKKCLGQVRSNGVPFGTYIQYETYTLDSFRIKTYLCICDRLFRHRQIVLISTVPVFIAKSPFRNICVSDLAIR